MSQFIRIYPSSDPRAMNLAFKGEWPPPEKMVLIAVDGTPVGARPATDDDLPSTVLHRVSCSEITDDEIASMSHVARGALYVEDPNTWDGRT
jgi:hypothetical protein